MPQQLIGTGSAPNDGTGDPGRTAWTKANANFTELYTSVSLGPPGTAATTLTVNGNSVNAALPALIVFSTTNAAAALLVQSTNTSRIASFRCDLGTGGYIAYNRNAIDKGFWGDSSLLLTGGTLDDIALKSNQNLDFAAGGPNKLFSIKTTGDMVGRGVGIAKQKPAATNRASVTVLANDPDLTYAIPVAGTYAVDSLIPLSGGAGGVSFNLNYSGTITASQVMIELIANSAPVADKSIQITNAVTTSLQSAATVAGNDIIIMRATLAAGTTGTLAVSWAQNSSNVANTTFGQGSYMLVTQLS